MHNGPKSPVQSAPQSTRMIREDDIPTMNRHERIEQLFSSSPVGNRAQKSNIEMQRQMQRQQGWLV